MGDLAMLSKYGRGKYQAALPLSLLKGARACRSFVSHYYFLADIESEVGCPIQVGLRHFLMLNSFRRFGVGAVHENSVPTSSQRQAKNLVKKNQLFPPLKFYDNSI